MSTPSSTDPSSEASPDGVQTEEKAGELKLVGSDGAEEPASEAAPSSDPLEPEPEPSRPPQAATPRPEESEAGGRRGVPIWVLILLALVFAGVVSWQLQQKGQLERRIAGLEQELGATRAQLGAHRSRLVEIRGGVQALADQVQGLKTLVDADPSEPVALPTAQAAEEPRPSIPARLPQR